MYNYTEWRCAAAGRVNADGTVDAVFGCSVTKNAGLGSYRLTVFQIPPTPGPPAPPPDPSLLVGQGVKIPANRLTAVIAPIGATPRNWSINDVSDDAKDILIATDLGVLVDNEFCFNIGQFLPAL